MIGLPKSSLATPVARSSARAPAMFRPCVTVRDLNGGIAELPRDEKLYLPRRLLPYRGPSCGGGFAHRARGRGGGGRPGSLEFSLPAYRSSTTRQRPASFSTPRRRSCGLPRG